jgi:hypothetical protein
MNIIIQNKKEGVTEMFWTDATLEDVAWCIHTNNQRYDTIMKWDRNTIKTNIGWVRYHLFRAGFNISEIKPIEEEHTFNVDTMELVHA